MIKIIILKRKQHKFVCVITLISSIFSLYFLSHFLLTFSVLLNSRNATIKHFFALQLSSTKSVDGQVTLVHFLEDIIETKYPEISGFENELTHVEQAARGKSTSPRL